MSSSVVMGTRSRSQRLLRVAVYIYVGAGVWAGVASRRRARRVVFARLFDRARRVSSRRVSRLRFRFVLCVFVRFAFSFLCFAFSFRRVALCVFRFRVCVCSYVCSTLWVGASLAVAVCWLGGVWPLGGLWLPASRAAAASGLAAG